MNRSDVIPAALVLVGAGFGGVVAQRDGAALGVIAGFIAAFPLVGVRWRESLVPALLVLAVSTTILGILGGAWGTVLLGTAAIGAVQVGATLLVATWARGAAMGIGWGIGGLLLALPFRAIPELGMVPVWAGDGNPVTRLVYACGIDWFHRPALYPTLGTAYSGSLTPGADKTVLWGCLAAGVVAWVASGIVQTCRARQSGSQS